jgi:hypothetical protein
MAYNPYAADESAIEDDIPQYSMPRGTYAAPSLQDGDAYTDTFGWGPQLRVSTTDTPSAQRLGDIPTFQDYPSPSQPPEVFYGKKDADKAERSEVETIQQRWNELKGVAPGDQRWAPNPRLNYPEEPRITQGMSPGTYSFTRPFDQFNRQYGDVIVGSARHFTGMHFSMADHKRNYDVSQNAGGMPNRRSRNTYRIEPTPWDTDVVDMPASSSVSAAPEARILSVDVQPGSRSMRLM